MLPEPISGIYNIQNAIGIIRIYHNTSWFCILPETAHHMTTYDEPKAKNISMHIELVSFHTNISVRKDSHGDEVCPILVA